MFFFGAGDDMPDELREAIEHQQAHSEAHQHDIKDFIEGLNQHDLGMLKSLIFPYSQNPSAAYLVGIMNSVADARFGICHACSKKHDDITVEDVVGTDPGRPREVVLSEMSGGELIAELPEAVLENLDKYNLLPLNKAWPKVKCAGCGTIYQSLNDRMARAPGKDGCSNCVQKEKWG